MAEMRDWPNTAAGHNQGSTPDWPVEGWSMGSMNDTLRETRAVVRRQWEQHSWFDYGHDVTYVSDTVLEIAGDHVATYYDGRDVRVETPSTGAKTFYLITAVELTGGNNTQITLLPYGGQYLNETGLKISVGLELMRNLSLGYSAGDRILLQSEATPTRFFRDLRAEYDDAALRLATGALAAAGTRGASDLFKADYATAGHTLVTAEIPSHRHFTVRAGTDGGPPTLTASNQIIRYRSGGGDDRYNLGGNAGEADVGRTSPTGDGGSHSHVVDLEVKYVSFAVYQARTDPNPP